MTRRPEPPRAPAASPLPRRRSGGWASRAQRHFARRGHREGRAEDAESEDESRERDAPEQSFVRLKPWDRDRAAFVAGAPPRQPRGLCAYERAVRAVQARGGSTGG